MSKLYKYPRTYHCPWSESATSDDKTLSSMEKFHGKEVVVTTKYDGENSSLYSDYYHARSLNGCGHPSRNWLKTFHATICQNIPENWRVVGENLFAKHSIAYENLPSFFLGFSIWNQKNECLSWDETVEWFSLIGIEPVNVIWRGVYDEKAIRGIKLDFEKQEGYVIRVASSFAYDSFSDCVAKFVRKNHVQTDEHWKTQPVIPNKTA